MQEAWANLVQHMTPLMWAVAVVSAILAGMAKNGVPGLGILVVPMMAMIFPARLSIGALLPLLIVGDLLAIARFRHHAESGILFGLLPWTLAGIAAGAGLLLLLPANALKPLLGALVLALVILELVRKRGWLVALPHGKGAAPLLGLLAGIATTIGNSAGPLMNMYLLSRDFVRHRFIGTSAWFFFVVNTTKIPVFLSLSMMSPETVIFDLTMVPFVVLGALAGSRVLEHLSDRLFSRLVLLLSAAAAIRLLLP